ncbi:hypothetical protein LIER_32033 [Lithospermum erythrorhizon]|uniref:Protein kinase domain-containing protein n=1 Tax=Lithospermum erythrorhizon TaxID=34254 RepID=A0AAV3RW87_LITER
MHKFIIYLHFLASFYFISTSADLKSERSALLALRNAVGGRSLLWNISEPTPCKWVGVICSKDGTFVTELHLPGMGLSGIIPEKSISILTNLNTLSLRYNALVSPLPQDLSKLAELRNLYIQHNLFTGNIPEFIYGLSNLVRVNLADNKFNGSVSEEFGGLKRLGTLYLQNNNLSGSVPDLDLPGLELFNVSNNGLSGRIPDRLDGMPDSAFLGTKLCGKPLALCDGEREGEGGGKGKKLSKGAIAGIVIGSILGVLLLLLILFICCRKRGKKEVRSSRDVGVKEGGNEIDGSKDVESADRESGLAAAAVAAIGGKDKEKEESNVVGAKKGLVYLGKTKWNFDLEDLLKASAEVLGKGTFGTAYKAILEGGTIVAVKRLKDVLVSEKDFRDKMEEVGNMDHENLVPLRAYYYSGDEKLLVLEYMPMGSLSALLHGNKGAGRTPLNWETRAGIALGAARGISYLHSQGSSVSHGNIKSSNVLLSKSYEARVSDFGLAQVVAPGSTPNRVAGYRAPEVTDPRKVSQKADVYSFGVLLLELLTGKAPTHAILNEEGVDLPRWVQSVVKDEWSSEVFDLELLRYQNVEEDMVQLLQLAVDCTAQFPDNRPTMAEVTKRIEELCSSTIQEAQGDIVSQS